MPLNKTITEGLKPYSIGEKLRTLRLKKSMGLVQLGKHTGLSAAMLSKLERSKLVPTLPTLLRIALVFNVGLDYFFTDEKKRRIVAITRKSERLRFPERPEGLSSFLFESLDFKANERQMSAFFAEFESIPQEKARPHQHAGVEFLYVIEGKLQVTIISDIYELSTGDAIYFDSGVRHSYSRIGKHPCSAVVVTL